MPGGVEAVDADYDLARAEAARLDGVGDLLAGGGLGVGRHRILEVEDDGVGRQGTRLLDRAGVRSRHVKDAAARTDGHFCQISPRIEIKASARARPVPVDMGNLAKGNSNVSHRNAMSLPPRLIEGYEAFRSGRLAAEQSRYRDLAEHGQSPEIMVIGCCDSRVS